MGSFGIVLSLSEVSHKHAHTHKRCLNLEASTGTSSSNEISRKYWTKIHEWVWLSRVLLHDIATFWTPHGRGFSPFMEVEKNSNPQIHWVSCQEQETASGHLECAWRPQRGGSSLQMVCNMISIWVRPPDLTSKQASVKGYQWYHHLLLLARTLRLQ